MTNTNTEHHGGGFGNVIAGIEHFPGHLIAALKNKSSVITLLVNSAPAQELVAYEKTHGAEQLAAIKKAGMDVYTADRAKGIDKGTAILAAIRAAFECGEPEVKSLATLAMTLLLTEAAAELGV